MDVSLTFLGAAGTVTGSKFLVGADSSQFLVDAGLFQGLKALRRRNWDPLGFPATSLRGVVVSHAHLDHCGYLPALVRQGFNGPILLSADTAALAEIVLRDSAKLQMEDAKYASSRGYSKHRPPKPLYDADDVERTLPLFQIVDFDTPVPLGGGVTVRLPAAGHILGSASPVLTADGVTLAFSGDLGRANHPLLRPPAPPPAASAIIVESTYGDRIHPPHPQQALADAINRTVDRGGSVVIPAFAVDRTELLVLALQDLTRAGRIPRLPIFLDSPMALRGLQVYQAAVARGSGDVRPDLPVDLLSDSDVHEAHSTTQSQALNDPAEPSIIISASGMAEWRPSAAPPEADVARPPAQRPARRLSGGGHPRPGSGGRRDPGEDPRRVRAGARRGGRRSRVQRACRCRRVTRVAGLGIEPPQVTYVVHGEPARPRRSWQGGASARSSGWLAVVPRDGERVRVR